MTEGPVEETLPTGEKVWSYPDGRKVLHASLSLAGILDAQAEADRAAAEELTDKLVQAALDKREAQAAGDSLSSDKRAV